MIKINKRKSLLTKGIRLVRVGLKINSYFRIKINIMI